MENIDRRQPQLEPASDTPTSESTPEASPKTTQAKPEPARDTPESVRPNTTAPSVSADEDKVGYKNPPKHTRFKKGQSGNPKGRPRNPRPAPIDIHRALTACVNIRVGKREIWVTGTEARLRGIINNAVAGKVSAIRMFLEECERHRLMYTDPALHGGVITVPQEYWDEFTKEPLGPSDVDRFQKFPQWRDWLNKERPDEVIPEVRRRRLRKIPDFSESARDIFVRLAYERHWYSEGKLRGKEFVIVIILRVLLLTALKSIQASRLVDKYVRKYGERADGQQAGFLIVPEGLTLEEYIRKYQLPPLDWDPSEHPQGTDWVDWVLGRTELQKKNPSRANPIPRLNIPGYDDGTEG
jgi:hypothetical protein